MHHDYTHTDAPTQVLVDIGLTLQEAMELAALALQQDRQDLALTIVNQVRTTWQIN